MISISKLSLFIPKQSKIKNSVIPSSLYPLLVKKFHQPKTLSRFPKMSSWACAKCTYINPPTETSHCEICRTPPSTKTRESSPSPSPSPSKPKWPCASCTFLNPYHITACEICGARASASVLTTLEVDDDESRLGSSIGSVFLPLQNLGDAERGSSGAGAGYYGGFKGSSVSPLRRVDCGGFGRREKTNVGSGGGGMFDFGGGKGLVRCSNKRKEREMDDSGDGGFGGKKGFSLLSCSNNKMKEREADDGEVDDNASCGFRAPKSSKAVVVESLDVQESPAAAGGSRESSESKSWKVLSYNVWFREDLEMRERMRALGNLIELHSPHIICFQEVTPNIYEIFQKSRWWKTYRCSITDESAFPGGYFCMQLCKLPLKSFSTKPFHNSIMGRSLCIAEVETQPGTSITVATSHLESPCPGPPKWDQMFSKERVVQANEAVRFLDKDRNVIFCGDMNWDDKQDGPFPLLDGWADAWAEMRPGEVGWTYDTKSNKMISGNKALQKRLDRFVCKLKDFRMSEIEMIGKDAIPGLTYVKEKKVRGKIQELVLPVLPSDHYGMLLTISETDSS